MTHTEIARIFTEWKDRYDNNPEWFMAHGEFEAEKPETYGEGAARYFLLLKEDVEASD